MINRIGSAKINVISLALERLVIVIPSAGSSIEG